MPVRQHSETDGKTHNHFSEFHSVFRKTALFLLVFAALWSTISTSMIGDWVLAASPEGNESVMSLYSPMDWVGVRWTLILLLSSISVLPIFSILIYRFSRSGLYGDERRWLATLLSIFSIIAPFLTVAIWTWGISAIFSVSEEIGAINGVEEMYDVSMVVELSLGMTWVVLIITLTSLALAFSRFILSSVGEGTRFRIRLMLMSTGILILTLPVVYDGLRVIIAVSAIIAADQFSKLMPVRE